MFADQLIESGHAKMICTCLFSRSPPAWLVMVWSVEPSSTTITSMRSRSGDSAKIFRRSRLAYTRYCSLQTGTSTESEVGVFMEKVDGPWPFISEWQFLPKVRDLGWPDLSTR